MTQTQFMRTTLCFFILIFSNTTNAFAQFGTLDNTFNEDGKLTSEFYYVRARCVAVQKNGKILVGGAKSTGYEYGYLQDFFLARYNTDGSLDKEFGDNGSIVTDISGEVDQAFDLAIQMDGKILLAGHGSIDTQIKDFSFAVARYSEDGILDSSFGDNGKVLGYTNGSGKSIAVLNDESFLVGGSSYKKVYDSNSSDFYHSNQFLSIVKYHSDGSRDSSFGNYGVLLIDFGNSNRIADGISNIKIQVQQDGKILIAGTLMSAGNPVTFSTLVITRVTQNGVIDSSFGANGIAIIDADRGLNKFASMLLQNDQKIVVTGNIFHNTYVGSVDSIFTIRLKQNGKIDISFGEQGKKITVYNNKPGIKATSSLLLPGGEILIAGYSYYDSSFLLTALNNNGILDSSFGSNGFTVTRFRSGDGSGNNGAEYDVQPFAYDMDMGPDGKIVLAGTYNYKINSFDYEDIALARYNGQTVLPITLYSFSATKKQNSVLLNWQTASESNNSYFIIERSNNNSDFKELGKVNSKGNSTQVQQYNFEDHLPFNGANYYRLKQVNKDGTATTSKTVLVDFSKAAIIKIYPNPVKNVITIEGLTGQRTTISIIDINGKVLTITSTYDQTYTWNIKALPQGTYYLRTDADKKVNTTKFIKE